jgi:phosphate transport system permease protein
MTAIDAGPVLGGRSRDPEPPAPNGGHAAQLRIALHRIDTDEVFTVVGAFGAAVGLTWVVYERLLPFSGALGFWLVVYVAFLAMYAGAAGLQWSRQVVLDRVIAVGMVTGAILVLAIVLAQVIFTAARGWPAIHHGNFWTQSMILTDASSALTSGGMVHALIGSLEQLGLATAFSVPLGITAALFLVEVGGRLARPVRIIVEAMTALPEIIAGLFIYALVILTLGFRQSGMAAALALTVMMIPVVTRTAEVILRLVPGPLREASYALGASQTRTLWNVVLPTARSGLSTAVVLAMARAVGETSPVLLTAGFFKGVNSNPFSGQQTSLPLYIYNYVKFPSQAMIDRGFGAAIALMLMVLVLFTLARLIGGNAPGELTGRQRRAIARAARAASLPAPAHARTSAVAFAGPSHEISSTFPAAPLGGPQ